MIYVVLLLCLLTGGLLMARGHSDWGQAAPTGQVSPVADLGELAARLGSLDTYSRTGNVLFADGFEDGLAPWGNVTSGTGAAVTVETDISYSGAQAAKLVGGSTSVKLASLIKQFEPMVLERIGMEWTFALETANDWIDFDVDYFTGSKRYLASIRLTESSQTLAYRVADGSYTSLATVNISNNDPRRFHTLKLVIDLSFVEYVRLYFDQARYSLSGVTLRVENSTGVPRVDAGVDLHSRAGNNDILRVDNFIFTTNEP